MDAFVAAYCLIVGLAIPALWIVLFVTGQVPELETAPWTLGFHLAAEFAMAMALIFAGLTRWRRGGRTSAPAWFALGMGVYSMVNAAGYYAQRNDWGPVIMFAVLLMGAGVVALRLGPDR